MVNYKRRIMKQIVEHKDYLLVGVPFCANGFAIEQSGIYWQHGRPYPAYIGFYPELTQDTWEEIELPSGNYSIVGLAKDLKETDWMNIAEDSPTHAKVWKDYTEEEKYKWTATQSGYSLLKHHGFELSTCLVLNRIVGVQESDTTEAK